MNTIFKYTVLGVGIYFAVNWIADNPKSMQQFRSMMNRGVATAADVASKVLDEVKNGASQSLDK